MEDGELSKALVTTARRPICSIIAGATLFLCLFTPYLLVMIPVMFVVGLSIAAAFRKETPTWLPYLIGGLAVVFVIAVRPHSFVNAAPTPSPPNSETYKDATWQYGSSKDDMRGTLSKWATLDSPTDFSLDAPYDGQNSARIQTSFDGGLILTIDKGQFICNSDDHVAVKYDNGPVFNYPCSLPTGGQTGTIYINTAYDLAPGQPATLVDGIVKAKKMVIEVELYESGSRQIQFNVAGLDKSKS